jgi:hypothetical protein
MVNHDCSRRWRTRDWVARGLNFIPQVTIPCRKSQPPKEIYGSKKVK